MDTRDSLQKIEEYLANFPDMSDIDFEQVESSPSTPKIEDELMSLLGTNIDKFTLKRLAYMLVIRARFKKLDISRLMDEITMTLNQIKTKLGKDTPKDREDLNSSIEIWKNILQKRDQEMMDAETITVSSTPKINKIFNPLFESPIFNVNTAFSLMPKTNMKKSLEASFLETIEEEEAPPKLKEMPEAQWTQEEDKDEFEFVPDAPQPPQPPQPEEKSIGSFNQGLKGSKKREIIVIDEEPKTPKTPKKKRKVDIEAEDEDEEEDEEETPKEAKGAKVPIIRPQPYTGQNLKSLNNSSIFDSSKKKKRVYKKGLAEYHDDEMFKGDFKWYMAITHRTMEQEDQDINFDYPNYKSPLPRTWQAVSSDAFPEIFNSSYQVIYVGPDSNKAITLDIELPRGVQLNKLAQRNAKTWISKRCQLLGLLRIKDYWKQKISVMLKPCTNFQVGECSIQDYMPSVGAWKTMFNDVNREAQYKDTHIVEKFKQVFYIKDEPKIKLKNIGYCVPFKLEGYTRSNKIEIALSNEVFGVSFKYDQEELDLEARYTCKKLNAIDWWEYGNYETVLSHTKSKEQDLVYFGTQTLVPTCLNMTKTTPKEEQYSDLKFLRGLILVSIYSNYNLDFIMSSWTSLTLIDFQDFDSVETLFECLRLLIAGKAWATDSKDEERFCEWVSKLFKRIFPQMFVSFVIWNLHYRCKDVMSYIWKLTVWAGKCIGRDELMKYKKLIKEMYDFSGVARCFFKSDVVQSMFEFVNFLDTMEEYVDNEESMIEDQEEAEESMNEEEKS